jgi:regulatory protein
MGQGLVSATNLMDRPIFLKAASYCAYQERTQDEVRQRLKDWNVWGDDEAEEIISELDSREFL